MEKGPKLRPLYLAQILYERTDEDHYLATAQWMEILEKEHGFKFHQQTIPADVAALRSFGMEISSFIRPGKRRMRYETAAVSWSWIMAASLRKAAMMN